MSVAELQTNLAGKGFSPGPIDNDFGAKTLCALMGYAAGRQLGEGGWLLALGMAPQFALAQVNTRLRIAHAVAQACHETGGFRWLTELGSTAYFSRYDGRADLGNTQPGDGARFRGRGIIQITGRDNYTRYGQRLSVGLVGQPERAAEPEIAAAVFCLYWTDKGLNAFADANNAAAVSRGINRGNPRSSKPANHEPERQVLVEKLLAIWPA